MRPGSGRSRQLGVPGGHSSVCMGGSGAVRGRARTPWGRATGKTPTLRRNPRREGEQGIVGKIQVTVSRAVSEFVRLFYVLFSALFSTLFSFVCYFVPYLVRTVCIVALSAISLFKSGSIIIHNAR